MVMYLRRADDTLIRPVAVTRKKTFSSSSSSSSSYSYSYSSSSSSLSLMPGTATLQTPSLVWMLADTDDNVNVPSSVGKSEEESAVSVAETPPPSVVVAAATTTTPQ